MKEITIIICITVLAVLFVVNACFANRMQNIAEIKGSKDRYWAWCFWIPLLGALMIIALPDRNNQTSCNDRDELPPLI